MGEYCQAWHGVAWSGLAGQGEAGHGKVWAVHHGRQSHPMYKDTEKLN
jgi:hypothetical protein